MKCVFEVIPRNDSADVTPDDEERVDEVMQDEPLDLSTKKKEMRRSEMKLQKGSNDELMMCQQDPIQHLIQSVEQSAAEAASIMASVRGNQSYPSGGSPTPADNSHYVNRMPVRSGDQVAFDPTLKSYSKKGGHHHHPQLTLHQLQQYEQQQQQLDKNGNKSGNTHQRSVIKQKLEDAFRQNGFLVKTKQVSDGDATFCKFRQLRKYTRYYLKSWHKHLPDEVNKLYKGFLPPNSTTAKTATASSAAQPNDHHLNDNQS